MYGTNVETISSAVLPPAQQAAADAGTLLPNDVTNDNPSWGWTAGAGISTAPDLVRYVQALVGGGLLDPALQRLRLASVRPVDPTQPDGPEYGLGIAKFGPLYGHTGELPGYQSFMGYDPVHKVTVVVLTSLSAAPDGTPPANAISKLIIGRIYGAPSTAGSATTGTQ
jgi:D-alanyl-D-alanine carboxypeptidase